MQGRTHLVAGTALALGILYPKEAGILIAGTGAAALGSVISDIDSAGSGAGQDAMKAGAACAAILIAAFFADAFFQTGIYEQMLRQGSRNSGFMWMLGFVLLCAFGILSSHRSFMHSLMGGVLLTGCVWKMLPSVWQFFAIGFASHLVLDLMNRKGIRLLFPKKKLYCLGWFKSSGRVNRILLTVGTVALILFFWRSAKPLAAELDAAGKLQAAKELARKLLFAST